MTTEGKPWRDIPDDGEVVAYATGDNAAAKEAKVEP